MGTKSLAPQLNGECPGAALRQRVAAVMDDLMSQLPNPEMMDREMRSRRSSRGTPRFWKATSFIESDHGNLLGHPRRGCAARFDRDLHEEVRDSHPAMLRRFAMAANAFPRDTDAMAVSPSYPGPPVPRQTAGCAIALMMAFFEGYIQRFHGLPG